MQEIEKQREIIKNIPIKLLEKIMTGKNDQKPNKRTLYVKEAGPCKLEDESR